MASITHPGVFGPTDPGTLMALANLPPISRTVLTLPCIDPTLARAVERDRQRTSVEVIPANPAIGLMGIALHGFLVIWRRCVPVPACNHAALPMVDVDSAGRLITALSSRYGLAGRTRNGTLDSLTGP